MRTRRGLPPLLLAAVSGLAALAPARALCAEPPRPNIVFILADDMGYGDVGCYNPDSKIPTPNIDRLAREGIRFTDAHSPSAVCTPTRYGLLTGRYCWRTWLRRGVVGGYTGPLIEPDRVTVASFLRAQGYRTAFAGKWHLGLGWERRNGLVVTHENAEEHYRGSWQDGDPSEGMDVDFTKPVRGGPLDLGFDHAYLTAACSTIDGPFAFIEGDRTVGIPDTPIAVDRSRHPDFRPRPGWIAPGFDLETVDLAFTERAVDLVRRFHEEDPERPFFLYLALSSPHAPWLPPSLTRGRTEEGPRGDLVALADECVGRITRVLDELGLAEETLLIVTSDNGPRHGADGHAAAGPLRGHKSHIWEGGHRVPFVARWSGRIPEGAVSGEPIELTDMLRTFASLIGEDLPEDAGPDSYDVLPAILGEEPAAPIREAIVSHSVFGVFSVRQGPWKLIQGTETSGGWVEPRGEGPKHGAPGQLYHLEDDPGETRNLYAERPEVVERLRALLASYRREGRSAPRGRGEEKGEGKDDGAKRTAGDEDAGASGKGSVEDRLRIEHAERRMEGWRVHIDTRLLEEGEGEGAAAAEVGATALRIVSNGLHEIALVLPEERLEKLREVPIFLDLDHPLRNMQYHPSVDWLRDHGHDPAMEKAVHVPDARRMIDVRRRNTQPWVFLHELAHAYHDRVLGFDHRPIREAFRKASESGRYEEVLHISGTRRRHYALTDHKEFFAEMSESYFGTNDFYPFVRAELEEYDPETHALLEEVWGKRE